jgi:hypothetical protein
MWKKYPDQSGFYWYFYLKEGNSNRVVCQYERVSNLVLFPGGGATGTPLEHLESFGGLWAGPLEPPLSREP